MKASELRAGLTLDTAYGKEMFTRLVFLAASKGIRGGMAKRRSDESKEVKKIAGRCPTTLFCSRVKAANTLRSMASAAKRQATFYSLEARAIMNACLKEEGLTLDGVLKLANNMTSITLDDVIAVANKHGIAFSERKFAPGVGVRLKASKPGRKLALKRA